MTDHKYKIDDPRSEYFDPLTCTPDQFLQWLQDNDYYTQTEIERMRLGANLIKGQPQWPTKASNHQPPHSNCTTSSGAIHLDRTTQSSTDGAASQYCPPHSSTRKRSTP